MVNIEYQRLEQVCFAIVPEMIAAIPAGIGDDNIAQNLGEKGILL